MTFEMSHAMFLRDELHSTSASLRHVYSVIKMPLVKIKKVYDYYSNKRVTPVFARKEELVNLLFEEFKSHLLTEVPYFN